MRNPVFVYEVQGRTVYGWVQDEAATHIEIHEGKPPANRHTGFLGTVSQHANGMWAATWNLIPNIHSDFPYDSAEEAVAALPERYPRVWKRED